MLLRETIDKTKVLFHKTFRNVKSFLCGGYQRLPTSLSFNPFTCSSGYGRNYTRDQFYNEFYDHLQSDLSIIKRVNSDVLSGSKEPPEVEDASCTGSFMKFSKQREQTSTHEGRAKHKIKGTYQVGKKKENLSHHQHKKNGGAHVLAQKMKELEMMDAGDVEQVLDIEEALHYYSRLTSPVYLDIVDKFFVDMHSEFSASQPPVSIKPSKGRRRSIRL
ncbi:uncharacterized protein LOC129288595 [Prosopis cineraria]|uniref:uncharacterized protein LOC129288595 n=1 Tax=Prosopis cineraria TaxID=364024 RepID=UPI00240FECDF|nr:uncharacterized protein LOC129288595 [Prosopis cineraria]